MQPKASFIAHGLFPAVVALWSAALLGAGVLVLPSSLLERIVALSGLPALFPAAQPPLGATATMLIAVIAALAGAIAGYLAAHRIAAMRAAAEDREPAGRNPRLEAGKARMRRPISAKDEFDVEHFDAPFAPEPAQPEQGRADPGLPEHRLRRFLSKAAVQEQPDPAAGMVMPEAAAPEAVMDAGLEPTDQAEPDAGFEPAPDIADHPGDDSGIAAPGQLAHTEWPESTGAAGLHDAALPGTQLPDAETADEEGEIFEPRFLGQAREQDTPPAEMPAPEDEPETETEAEAEVEAETKTEAEEAFDPAPEPAAPEPSAAPAAHQAHPPRPAMPDSLGELPLEELGMVQLAERLALSLQKRMERNRKGGSKPLPPPPPGLTAALGRLVTNPEASADSFRAPSSVSPAPVFPAPLYPAPVAAPLPQDMPEDPEGSGTASEPPKALSRIPLSLAPATPDEPLDGGFAPEASAEHSPGYRDTPAALRSLSYQLDDFGEEEDLGEEPEDEYDEEEHANGEAPGYSSLLGISTLPRTQPSPVGGMESAAEHLPAGERAPAPAARPFDTPASLASPQDREDTEEALRSALARLQRLSGAA